MRKNLLARMRNCQEHSLFFKTETAAANY